MVHFGALEGRIDPLFYRIDFQEIIKKITQNDFKKLGHLIDFSSETWNGKDYFEDIFPYIEISEIDILTGKINNISSIPINEAPSRAKMIVKNNDILVSTTRPNRGAISFVKLQENEIQIASTGFAVLRNIKAQIISKDFLFFCLRQEFSLKQMEQRSSGGNYPAITTEELKNVLIPLPPIHTQAQIVGIFEQAYEQKKANEIEAKRLLESIDGYLLDKLGISIPNQTLQGFENLVRSEPHFFVKFSQMQGKRFDPKKYTPENQTLLKRLENSNYERILLKNLLIQSVAGDWGLDNAEAGFEERLVIRATEFDNLYNLNLENDRVKYRFINKIKLAKMDLQVGDLLIEKSGGSEDQPVGRIAIITPDLAEKYKLAYSNFIHKIRIDQQKINPDYLFAFLKTIHNIKITDIMQSQTNGIRNLIMHEYLSIPIPLPPLEVQNEIADHISGLRAAAKRLENEAKTGLEEAKKQVEKLILGVA